MSNLVNEILLRLAKAGIAALLAIVLYLVLVGPFGATGSVELALLSGSARRRSCFSSRQACSDLTVGCVGRLAITTRGSRGAPGIRRGV